MLRRFISTLAFSAGTFLLAGSIRPVAAQDIPAGPAFDVVLAAHVSDAAGLGRFFAVLAGPAARPGTPPPAATPISGTLDVCVKSASGDGAVMVDLGSDAVERETDGCERVEVSGLEDLTVFAQRGAWDVIIRRLRPDLADGAVPADTSYLHARVPRTARLGKNISLMTAPRGAVGALPEPVAGYSGNLEVCASGDGKLNVIIDDARQPAFEDGPGCRTYAVSGAASITFVVETGNGWDVVVRHLD